MKRRTFDALVTVGGLAIALVLVAAGGLMVWAHNFVDNQIHTQLAAQHIQFPAKGSPALSSDPEIAKYVTPYAGQQVTNGTQAEVFANHYIAVHLRKMAGGATYSEVSGKFLKMKPTDADYQQVAQTRQTLFMGETLRGMLLNAYAFGTMAQVASIAATVSFVAAGVLLLLAGLGLFHLRRVAPEAEVMPWLHRTAVSAS